MLTRRRFSIFAAAAGMASRTALSAAAHDSPAILTLTDAAAAIKSGRLTATRLVEACLARIEKYQPKLNAFLTVLSEQARQEAAILDAEQRAGKLRGPLHGIPISLKDVIDTAHERTTGGTPFFKERIPETDATVVKRLRDAGAIIVGKNTLNELAMSAGESSYFGRVHNPWALDHETGGSSSGSCAAVAADLVIAAVGTDTGGSIRNPASWCGVVGLKPTNGLVSNRGTIPLTPILDTVGPIAKTAEDAAVLLSVIAGYDDLDVSSVEHAAEDYAAASREPVARFRVGLAVGHFDLLEPEVSVAINAAVETIRGLTAGVGEVSLPLPDEALSLMPFGETYAVHEDWLKAYGALYSAQDRATLQQLKDLRAADYIRARWKLELLRRTVNSRFSDMDVMIFPTTHTVAPRIEPPAATGGAARDPAALRDAGLLNVLGLPAISIPCGFTRAGLPIGLCVAGPRFGEGKLLALARAYEAATAWHLRKPRLPAA